MHSLFPSDDDWKDGVLERIRSSLPPCEPLPLRCDRWIAASILQKGIRRGEFQLALRAALVLSAYSRSYTWRRLLIIAFEDVGAAEPGALVETVAVATAPKWRAKHGEQSSLAYIIRRLAQAPKDRSADYLISAAANHPSLGNARRAYGLANSAVCLGAVADRTLTLPVRALATWLSSGVEGGGPRMNGGSLSQLGQVFQSLGADEDLVSATKLAAKRTREPIAVMVPLIWLEAQLDKQATVCNECVPDCPAIDGVPMYAFDKHTRLGLAAMQRLTRESEHIRNCLEKFVPKPAWLKAVQMAAFYTDGYLVSRRLDWSLSRPLECFGIESDFSGVRASPDAVTPLRNAISHALDRLNEIRQELWTLRHL